MSLTRLQRPGSGLDAEEANGRPRVAHWEGALCSPENEPLSACDGFLYQQDAERGGHALSFASDAPDSSPKDPVL